ncbi:MAG: hypothetical protein NTX87_07805 [Planctomycetota bacterium]|nr:hypothetical protein [Planctomycetota bacterium]
MGQHDTERFTQWAMNRDPSRLVNNASGWADAGVGPLYDIHDYSFCASIAQPGQLGPRALCLGECGGFNVIVPGHTWGDYKGKEDVDEIGERGRESYGDAASWEKRYALWVPSTTSIFTPHSAFRILHSNAGPPCQSPQQPHALIKMSG